MRKLLASVVAALALTSAATAWAQQATDYSVNTYAVGSKYESPPASATTVTLTTPLTGVNHQYDDGGATLTLPFSFTYFGQTYSSCLVCTNGFLTFGQTTYEWQNTGFPLTVTNGSLAGGGSMNGAVCAYWDDDLIGPAYTTAQTGTVQTWTSGTSPFRRFVVSWEGAYNYGSGAAPLGADGAGPFTYQIQLFETTNSIVLSYANNGTWPTSTLNANPGYTLGIQAVDGRYQYPSNWTNNAGANTGRPPNDYSFDVLRVTFTGRVLYDRYVVSSSGIGGTSEPNLPLAGYRVEARDSSGLTVGSATTDATGAFSMVAAGVQPNTTGSIVVRAENSVCRVTSTTGGQTYAATAATDVSYASDLDVGTLTIREGTDAGGTARGPLNICRVVQSEYDWAHARSADTIPALEVLYDSSSNLGTSYTAKAGSTPASMRLSATSANPDPWDVDVIRRTYARHVLGSIAANSTTAFDATFDRSTDAENAFAEGFGYYMVSVMTRNQRTFLDGTGANSTAQIDMETPTLSSGKSGTVAGWVAAALYDLVDPANESFDLFDGTGTAGEQVFATVDSMTSPVTSATFFDAWIAKGYDGPTLSKEFITLGLLADDADEPNDSSSEAKSLPQFGFVRNFRVLNLFNEDWYEFNLPSPTNSVTVLCSYDRGKYPQVVLAVELLDAANATVKSGTLEGSLGPVKLVTGALAAGKYRVRVAFVSGGPISSYSLQAFSELAFSADAFQPWTIGRPYNVPVNIKGGIAPYVLAVLEPSVRPEGLFFDGSAGRITGTPLGPIAGMPASGTYTYDFEVSAQDSAIPPNFVRKFISFTVNAAVETRFGEFTAFAQGKAVNRLWPERGGTAPFVSTLVEGGLPEGIAAQDGADVRFVGTAGTLGTTRFKLTATDVSGSSDTDETTGVVCGPFGAATLAAGPSACGFWFDAAEGSKTTISIATAKKNPVRALRVVVLGPDGSTPTNAVAKVGKGKATIAGFVAPASGRFYVIAASDDALGATQLLGKVKIAPPKAGAGKIVDAFFAPGDELRVPVGAIAGATVTFTVKPDKSGIRPVFVDIADPVGAKASFNSGDIKTKGTSVVLTKGLPAGGTWVVRIGADAAGAAGKFSWSFKIKQPPKAVYSAD